MQNYCFACKWAGCENEIYDSIDSTNARAKELGGKGASHGTLVVADSQSAGRGRLGREWISPKGVNIYMSLLLRPRVEVNKVSMLTLVMAVAVAKAMESVAPQIKWPNDILVGGKKVCGILTEMQLEQDGQYFVVIGVGINVKTQDFPEEIKEKATSLEEAGLNISREELLGKVLAYFEEAYEVFEKEEDLSGLQNYYEEHLVNKDAKVKVLDPKGEWEGIARGITAMGELLVEREAQLLKVYAGEVSVRGEHGYI